MIGERILDFALNVGATLEDQAGLIETAAGQAHGGGAGFSPYDPGDIGSGPDALGPLAPTALDFGAPEIILESPLDTSLSTLGRRYRIARPVHSA